MLCSCGKRSADPLCPVHSNRDDYGRISEYKDLSTALTIPDLKRPSQFTQDHIPLPQTFPTTIPPPSTLERLQFKRLKRDELVKRLEQLNAEITHLERYLLDKL